jgi:hypothetical protein
VSQPGFFMRSGTLKGFVVFDCAGGVYLPLLEATSVVSEAAGTSWASRFGTSLTTLSLKRVAH